mgnify:CR=1 FL=1
MKRSSSLTLIAAFAFSSVIPGTAAAWDIGGFEQANKDRGQWAWFTGQANRCDQTIPMPAEHTRNEWKEILSSGKERLPCGGKGISPSSAKHIMLFLHEHAADSGDPMNQKPASCG